MTQLVENADILAAYKRIKQQLMAFEVNLVTMYEECDDETDPEDPYPGLTVRERTYLGVWASQSGMMCFRDLDRKIRDAAAAELVGDYANLSAYEEWFYSVPDIGKLFFTTLNEEAATLVAQLAEQNGQSGADMMVDIIRLGLQTNA